MIIDLFCYRDLQFFIEILKIICTIVFELLKQFYINFKKYLFNVALIGKQLQIIGNKEQCV